jgi:hypothetical protein
MLPELDNLFNLAEKSWFQIAEGELFDEEIHDLNINIKNREMDIVRKYTAVCSLPYKKSHLDKAMVFAQTYFSNFYKLGGIK